MQLRLLCIIFTFFITVAFTTPAQVVMAKTATDTTTTDTKKKSSKPTKAATGKININNATAEELALIPGVGPVTAKSIIDYRKKNGKFKSTQDLLNIKGIGEKTLKKMKPQLKL